MSMKWMPVLNYSMSTVLPIFLLTFYVSHVIHITHINFVFDDHDYLQTSGTAMCTKMAQCFAYLFMTSIEQTFIDNSPLAPLFYVRFIDEIFMIWTHGSEELEQFTTRANSTHPSIKFTTEISSTSLPYLYVLVCVTETGIKTSLSRKPTDRPPYPMYCSFHPHHIKSSIAFRQLLRHKRKMFRYFGL